MKGEVRHERVVRRYWRLGGYLHRAYAMTCADSAQGRTAMRNEFGYELSESQARRRLFRGCELRYWKRFLVAPPRADRCFYLEDDAASPGRIIVVTTASEKVSVPLHDVFLPPIINESSAYAKPSINQDAWLGPLNRR